MEIIKTVRSSSFILLLFVLALSVPDTRAQEKKYNFVRITGDTKEEIIRKAANVVPSGDQYEWQKLECISFVHFGMNTFTGNEIGSGRDDPKLFNPTNLDCDQWIRVLKKAGMKLVILTAKHHDGFCLWPSRYTDYSVKSSNWKNGRGDVVREFVNACRKYHMKVGLYLSPWDRHNPGYGTEAYNEYFENQLTELLSNYGTISEVWFDGYRGPGASPETYDWHAYYRIIRRLQPHALIAIMGPDIRWVGTESGYGRDTEWDVLPIDLSGLDTSTIDDSKHPLDNIFVPHNFMGADLGSRDSLYNATGLFWYPAETDVSIRPGWFYKSSQDSSVKTPAELVDIYFSSVGKNSVLLLNVPPDTKGVISDYDIKSLMEYHKIIKEMFRTNFLDGSRVVSGVSTEGRKFPDVFQKGKYWSPAKGAAADTLEFNLDSAETFDVAMLREKITIGQRVENFHLEFWNGKAWENFTFGTTVGYERLLRFEPVTAKRVRLVIDRARATPAISALGLYMLPRKYLSINPDN